MRKYTDTPLAGGEAAIALEAYAEEYGARPAHPPLLRAEWDRGLEIWSAAWRAARMYEGECSRAANSTGGDSSG